MKIVVIDDDSSFLRQITEKVKRHNVHVESLNEKEKCLPELKQKIMEADLIFLDHNLNIRVDEIVEGSKLTGVEMFAWIGGIVGLEKARRAVVGISSIEQHYLARQLRKSRVLTENDVDEFLDDVSKFPKRFLEWQPE